MFKLIIAGSRSFSDYELLKRTCDALLSNQTEVEVVSGTANGADRLGERYATEKGFKIARFPADWDAFGKSAGYIRNKEMARYGDALVAFWDGSSKGTSSMIALATEMGLKVRVKRY